MADENRFLDPNNPSVERWLQILEDESELEAVIVLVQLIMDNLKDPCVNNAVGGFSLPDQIGDRFNFTRFVEAQIYQKDYEMQKLIANGNELAHFFAKMLEKSDNVSWMLQLCKVFRVLITDDRTQFFIEYSLIAWYMELLNIPVAHHNAETVRILNEVCQHLTETIVDHVKAFSVHKRIFIRFVENIQVHMVRNFGDVCVRVFGNIFKYHDPELINKTIENILRITINNEYVTNLFTVPEIVTPLGTILLKQFSPDTLQAALMLATRIQKRKPLTKLFPSRVFEDYLIEDNDELRKSCADLFKATFEVPSDANSFSLLAKVVQLFATLEAGDATVDSLVLSFSDEFRDWDKIYNVTLARSNNEPFLMDLWDHLVHGTFKFIRKWDPNNAEHHLIQFMHKGIDFLDQCDIMAHNYIYGLILSFIATQDKQLQLVDLAHRQKLANKLVAISLNESFDVYKHEKLAKNLMKALMIQKLIDVNAGANRAEQLLNENIFEEAVQSLADPNFDFGQRNPLCNKFMCLATMAQTGILQGQVGPVAVMTYKLLSHFKSLERNLDFWSYTIMACVESCAYIISKCKRRVDGQIDLNEVFGFLVEILSKCDGQVNFFTCTVFQSLCRMEFLKLNPGRPPSIDNFISFVRHAIDTFIANREEHDFPFHHLDSIIWSLPYVLLMAPQELNVHDLVVTVFRTFPAEDYVYLYIDVLARRLQHEAFVKSVIAIFQTFPLAQAYKKFAERTNEIIERVPEPRRTELRAAFNEGFVKEFGLRNIEHFPATKYAKAKRMVKAVIEIMIDPYFQHDAR